MHKYKILLCRTLTCLTRSLRYPREVGLAVKQSQDYVTRAHADLFTPLQANVIQRVGFVPNSMDVGMNDWRGVSRDDDRQELMGGGEFRGLVAEPLARVHRCMLRLGEGHFRRVDDAPVEPDRRTGDQFRRHRNRLHQLHSGGHYGGRCTVSDHVVGRLDRLLGQIDLLVDVSGRVLGFGQRDFRGVHHSAVRSDRGTWHQLGVSQRRDVRQSGRRDVQKDARTGEGASQNGGENNLERDLAVKRTVQLVHVSTPRHSSSKYSAAISFVQTRIGRV